MGSQEQIFPAREGRQHRQERRGASGWTPLHTRAKGLGRGRREKQEEI